MALRYNKRTMLFQNSHSFLEIIVEDMSRDGRADMTDKDQLNINLLFTAMSSGNKSHDNNRKSIIFIVGPHCTPSTLRAQLPSLQPYPSILDSFTK